ncbi:hypothetical protein OV320_7796 [Actinobacteria bacterium OV320]|jgi:hypothetical protein|nr:hypothetical protein OV320_7796 [Actinobacteria bacterium OV320]
MTGIDGEAKARTFATRAELLDKLGRKEALWHRAAIDAQERRAEFDKAAQDVMAGANSVTVGRTTYTVVVDEDTDVTTDHS